MSAYPPTSLIKLKQLPDGPETLAQFNPASLQYTITNTAPTSNGSQPSREVENSTGKLSFELLFDTTDNGSDVRTDTQRIALFMRPGERRRTPVISLTWGAFRFEGALEQYQETLDFFSANGVPLRATLSLVFTTVTENNRTPASVFAFAGDGTIVATVSGGALSRNDEKGETIEVPAQGSGASATKVAQQAGDARGARAVGALNGLESIRNPVGGVVSLQVNASVTLSPPIAFSLGGGTGIGAALGGGIGIGGGAGLGFGASAGAGFGFGASAGGGASATGGVAVGAGVSGGMSFGVSGGAAVGLSAGASAGLGLTRAAGVGAGSLGFQASASTRGSASAGVSATQGAFVRLRPQSAPVHQRFDVNAVLRPSSTGQLATDTSGAFEVGGRARTLGSASFHADVGQQASLQARLSFEEE